MNNFMQYKGYVGSIEFSQQDMLFYGKVLGITSLISYEGIDAESLTSDFYASIDAYLEMCEERNTKPERPYKGSFNVRIAPDLHRQLAIISKKNDVSLNTSVERAIINYIDHEDMLLNRY